MDMKLSRRGLLAGGAGSMLVAAVAAEAKTPAADEAVQAPQIPAAGKPRQATREPGPELETDRYFRDPVSVDSEAPPALIQRTVESGGSFVPIKLYLADGAEPKGTLIINPPLGGGEAMNSVVIPVLYAGINVIIQRPRGVRDPKNVYSMPNAVDDLHATIAWIAANASNRQAPLSGRLDPTRICMMGMSGGGGNNSYATAAESRQAHYAIAVNPGNMEYQLSPEMVKQNKPGWDALRDRTRGRSDYGAWLLAMTPEEIRRVDILRNAPKLIDKHLLYIGGAQDSVSPIDITLRPNTKGLKEAGVKDLTTLIIDDDHSISLKRYTLARMVTGWLKSQGF